MKSFKEFMKSKQKNEASSVRRSGRVNPAVPDDDEHAYDQGVDDYMHQASVSQVMGDKQPPVPSSLQKKAQAASADRPAPRMSKTLPSPKSAPFEPSDDAFHAAVDKIRGELAHYKPGMVLRAILPKADSVIVGQLLDAYGEE